MCFNEHHILCFMAFAMSDLKFTIEQIVWQEVPGEVSLAFLFSGCPLRCKGCHSADTWKEGIGTELTEDY